VSHRIDVAGPPRTIRRDRPARAAHRLHGLLLESLEPEAEEGVEQAWVAEVERRMAELDSGAVQPIAWEELRARLYGGSGGPSRR
jgi:putative addiction module component (TIGR02574 family)